MKTRTPLIDSTLVAVRVPGGKNVCTRLNDKTRTKLFFCCLFEPDFSSPPIPLLQCVQAHVNQSIFKQVHIIHSGKEGEDKQCPYTAQAYRDARFSTVAKYDNCKADCQADVSCAWSLFQANASLCIMSGTCLPANCQFCYLWVEESRLAGN